MTDSQARFAVLLTEGAARDIEEIYRYISDTDSPENADTVLDQLLKVVHSLSRFPERGTFPRELIELGIKEYRQVLFKPYRVIYRMMGNQLFIYLIIDGRRDMQSALARRLLGG
jgi:toxin ParE1/3/4